MRRCAAVLTVLLALVPNDPPSAEEVAAFLRRELGVPETAVVAWPPLRDLAPGSLIGARGDIVERDDVPTNRETFGSTAGSFALESRHLDPVAFWAWRLVLAELPDVSFRLRLGARVREVMTDPVPNPAGDGVTRVGTVWLAKVSIEVTPTPAMAPERWRALRQAALDDQSETITVAPAMIRLEPKDPLALAWAPAPSAASRPGLIPGRLVHPKRWALATIASGHYRALPPSMSQDWNRESARLVRESLVDWSPTTVKMMDASPGEELTRDRVLRFVDSFMQQAKRERAELAVIYYVGHMERAGTGNLSLLMGDAPAQRPSTPRAPHAGVGNLRDLAQVVDQARAELATDSGTVDVAVIHRRLSVAGIPFVLLVDGCLDDRPYAEARDRLGIVIDPRGGEPRFAGPGDAGTALRAMLRQLEDFATDFPWLKSRNPTILGATPGTLAFAAPHPRWLLGPPVAPIAERVAGIVARTRGDADRLSMIRVLNLAADRQRIGPQELSGTVSWSDWMPHLRRFDPRSFN